MEQAYQNSDTSYDGVFYLGVRTTGIFCRPSCPARKPLPHNVAYYAAPRDALFAGFRPCKRCDPMNLEGTPPDWVQGLLAEVERDPTVRLPDSALRERGIDPARARRHFLKHYGMTFQAYLRGRRMGQALAQIREGADLDDVTLGNGYESHSGFREAFNRTFGLSPGRAQSADYVRVAMATTPLGPMVLGATTEGLCLAEFTNRRMLKAQFEALQRHFRCAVVPGQNLHLEAAQGELDRYFAGELKAFSVPLVYPGSDFQRAVWDRLLAIPYGQTRSYEWLAQQVGRPAAVRAVGTTNGLNRIALFIPCHRVVNKSGKLGGYGGGVWRKQALLDLERGQRTFFEAAEPPDGERVASWLEGVE
jgi:AraC family transcriptional regulator of adaptative response/methylated-DNA-[protein]-cysteine methyltransferase